MSKPRRNIGIRRKGEAEGAQGEMGQIGTIPVLKFGFRKQGLLSIIGGRTVRYAMRIPMQLLRGVERGGRG
jgi:hypothetical protein